MEVLPMPFLMSCSSGFNSAKSRRYAGIVSLKNPLPPIVVLWGEGISGRGRGEALPMSRCSSGLIRLSNFLCVSL